MLNGVMTLYDLRDVEAFCSAALDQTLKRWRSTLEPSDRDDLLAYLISETWRISTRYNPALSRSFTQYARPFQPRFIIQFYRDRFIDTRYKRRYTEDQWAQIQQVVFPGSFDQPHNEDEQGRQYPPAPEHQQDQLEFTIRTSTGDPAADCHPDLARILHRRNLTSNRMETRRNQPPHERTTTRAA